MLVDDIRLYAHTNKGRTAILRWRQNSSSFFMILLSLIINGIISLIYAYIHVNELNNFEFINISVPSESVIKCFLPQASPMRVVRQLRQ